MGRNGYRPTFALSYLQGKALSPTYTHTIIHALAITQSCLPCITTVRCEASSVLPHDLLLFVRKSLSNTDGQRSYLHNIQYKVISPDCVCISSSNVGRQSSLAGSQGHHWAWSVSLNYETPVALLGMPGYSEALCCRYCPPWSYPWRQDDKQPSTLNIVQPE